MNFVISTYSMLMLLSLFSFKCNAQTWYKFKLLINPGLQTPFQAASAQDCVYQCKLNPKCSAVSYQTGSSMCVMSFCASLHTLNNSGWNTYIAYPIFVENVDYPAPQLEWMLTDQCGLTATGNVSGGPPMVPTAGTGYNTSQSALQGQALWFNGQMRTFAITAPSAFMNLNYFTTGYTFSGWYYLEQYVGPFAFFELASQLNTYMIGCYYWIFNGGITYLLNDSGPTQNYYRTYPYSFPVGVWTHAAMVYSPTIPGVSIYINGVLMATYNIGSPITSHNNFTVAVVGARPDYGIFSGRAYCIRVHLSTLDSNQITKTANSCSAGRIRFG